MDALRFVHVVIANTQNDSNASRIEENQISGSKILS